MALFQQVDQWLNSLPMIIQLTIDLGLFALAVSVLAHLFFTLVAQNILFTHLDEYSAVIIERDDHFDCAFLRWKRWYYNDPRRPWFNPHYSEWMAIAHPNADATFISPFDNAFLKFLASFGYYWIGPGRSVFFRSGDAQQAVGALPPTLYVKLKEEQQLTAQATQERAEAEATRKANEPDEIAKRERGVKIAAIEAEFQNTKPVQPPPKSKRLTEAERVARETTGWTSGAGFINMMLFIPYSMLMVPLGSTGVFLFALVSAGIWIIGYSYNKSNSRERYFRAQRQDEDKKWAEEDAVWSAYERRLTMWEEHKRQRIAGIDTSTPRPSVDIPLTPKDDVSDLAKSIVEQLRRGR